MSRPVMSWRVGRHLNRVVRGTAVVSQFNEAIKTVSYRQAHKLTWSRRSLNETFFLDDSKLYQVNS